MAAEVSARGWLRLPWWRKMRALRWASKVSGSARGVYPQDPIAEKRRAAWEKEDGQRPEVDTLWVGVGNTCGYRANLSGVLLAPNDL
jgi:hypothetical protein